MESSVEGKYSYYNKTNDEEFDYYIIKHIGDIRTKYSMGKMTKELNLIQWGGNEPMLDLRRWSKNHKKMSKGITLMRSEAVELKRLLNSIDIEALWREYYP